MMAYNPCMGVRRNNGLDVKEKKKKMDKKKKTCVSQEVMGGVDSSRWKPRRTKGTVIYKTRNQFAWAVIAAGSVVFATFYTVVSYIGGDSLKQRLTRDFHDKTEEEVDRRNLMRFSFVAPKRGDTIRKLLEEEKEEQAKK